MLGAPGSGKGTQARLLSDHYKAPHISTGDLLREAIETGTKIGKEAKLAVDGGDLVPNELVIRLIEERLQLPDARRGFILDGFPRNIPQAQELDSRLGWMGRPLQIALNVSVDMKTLMKRLTGRLTCGECGAIYNEHFSRPSKPGVCDQCGAKKLKRRADDNEKTVHNRLVVYEQETAPLTAYYKAQQKLRSVVADGKAELIFEKICDIIDADIRPLEVRLVETDARPASAAVAATTVSTIAGGEVHKHTVIEKRSPPKKAVAAVLRVPSEVPAKAAVAPKSAKGSASGSAPRAKAATADRKAAAGKKQPAAGAGGKAVKKPAKKAPAKTTKKAAKKAAKPAVRKAAKKAAKKATKKVAKKGAKKATKKKVTKSVRKAANKSVPRSTKKSTAKKRSAAKAKTGKNVKRTTKKKVTTKRKVARKLQAKTLKKTPRKKTQKTARKAAKKIAKKAGKKTGKRLAKTKTAARKSKKKTKSRRR
jgi:adenylate kinase